MEIDVPEELQRAALADGCGPWLETLPAIVDGLAREWALTLGATMRGGHRALVVGAVESDGTPTVLKVVVPSHRRRLDAEAVALGLAGGVSCPRLLRQDRGRGALLLERLGPAMSDVVPDHRVQHDLLCDTVAGLWRPLDDDVDLPTGADLARRMQSTIPRLWHDLGRPCSARTIDDAVACAQRRERAHARRSAVLVHGDVHEANALLAADGSFKLIDPDGWRAEPACDLGTIVRCTPDADDDLRDRTERLAARTGVDADAIWEWGTVHRVIGGLTGVRVGFQPFGDLLLRTADRLARSR